MIKRYNITSCKAYQQNGVEKKTWPQVGTMVYFPATGEYPEKHQIELNMFPATRFFVFEQKAQNAPRTDAEPPVDIDADTGAMRTAIAKPTGNAKTQKVMADASGGGIEYPTDDINPDDIPF